ncbi:MAG: hypothetical protein M5U34_24555 [Chloroflexi bacterium]|nr:hypothetical protein [Chloroflexota bacterium]
MNDSKQLLDGFRQKPLPWLILGGLLTTAVFFLYLVPQEATLGTGIRSVYVHVALTWTGMAGFVLAGLLGLAVLASGREKLARWMMVLGWVAYGFYVAGVATSAVASRINWGGVFWQEPRMMAAFNSLAIATIIMVFNLWIPWVRLRGLLQAAIPLLVAWITYNAPWCCIHAIPFSLQNPLASNLPLWAYSFCFSPSPAGLCGASSGGKAVG